MKQSDIVKKISEEAGITTEQACIVIDSALARIMASVAEGDKVSFPGFGTFELKERAARTGVNPKTHEKIEIAAAKVPSFKAASAFKELLKI